MDNNQLEQLAQRLNLNFAFLQKIKDRFKTQDQTELIRISNEIRDLQNQTQANDDDALDFYTKQVEQKKQPQQVQQNGQPRQSSQALRENIPQAQVEQSNNTPQTTPQPPTQITPQQPSVQGGQFVKNFGDIANPTIRGVDVGGSVGIVDAMTGKKSYVTQTYANLNPNLEPTKGARNWGTDFRGGVGDELKNPFKADLEVIKAVDGHGDGFLGNRDNQGFGNQIVVRRTDTGEVLDMAHLNKGSLRGLKPGDRIKPGEQIAQIGKSGNVTGSHVSIETFDPDGKVKDISDIQPIDEQTPNVSTKSDGSIVYEKKDYIPSQKPEELPPTTEQPPQSPATPQTQQEQRALTGTEEKIISLLPQNQRDAARRALPDIASSLKAEGILNPKTLAYSIATVGHESGFVPKEEIMAQRGINPRNDYIAGLQENYSGGKEYRGRGYIQLTHDTNYKKYGDRIGVDLVNNPQLANDPKVASRVLAAYMKDTGVADAVNQGDYDRARVLIQGKGALNDQFIGNTRAIGQQAQNIEKALGDNVDTIFQSQEEPQKDIIGNITEEKQQPIGQQTEQQKLEKGVERTDIFSQAANKAKELITGEKPTQEKGKGFLGVFSTKPEEKTSPDQIKGGENTGIFNQYAENVGAATGSVANPEQQQEFQNRLQTGNVLFTPAQQQAQELKQEQESTFQDPLKRIQNAIQQTASASAQNAANTVTRGLNIIAPKVQAATQSNRPSTAQSFSSVRQQQSTKAFSSPSPKSSMKPAAQQTRQISSQAAQRSVAKPAPAKPMAAPIRTPIASSSAAVNRVPAMSKAPTSSRAPSRSAPAASRIANAVKNVAKKITSFFKR